jgi:hypothetical protein
MNVLDNYTLVTALFDIGRHNWTRFGRSTRDYFNYGKKLLQLNVPLIIFIDNQFVDFVKFHRKGKEQFTYIVPTSLRDLEFYKYYERIKQVQTIIQNSFGESKLTVDPEFFSPEYVVVTASKVTITRAAIKINPLIRHFSIG